MHNDGAEVENLLKLSLGPELPVKPMALLASGSAAAPAFDGEGKGA